MDSIPQAKLCRRCGVIKPRTSFRKASKEPDGHQYTCKDCRKPLECSAAYLETLRLESEGLQVCRVCRVAKPLSDFGKLSVARNGYKYDCKACRHVDRLRSYAAKREYNCAINKVYYQANKVAINAKSRIWQLRHWSRVLATAKRYRDKHPHVIRSARNRRYARQQAARTVPFSLAKLKAKLEYWGNRCWMCGAMATCVDHVKPLSKGGLHVIANLRPACTPCNIRKRDTWPYPTGGTYV